MWGGAWVLDDVWRGWRGGRGAGGGVPEARAVRAGRVPGAVLGWAGCLVVWGLASAMGVPRAGPLAAVMLASQPLWLANARRAGLDVSALTLGMAAAWAAILAVRRGALSWWIAGGALAGLSVGTKYVGLLAALAAAPMALSQIWRDVWPV